MATTTPRISPQIAYTVIATLPDGPTAEAYIAWLAGGHISDVIAGGALSGQIMRLDPAPGAGEGKLPQEVRVEVHYRFPDRATFDRYERDHAPALRAEGLARFGPERGVRFERRLGEVVAQLP